MTRRESVGQLRLNPVDMASFSVAPGPSSEKMRGGYYTPAPIAEFLASWVRQAGNRLLEPSCGDGAILQALSRRPAEAVGIEIEPEEARKAADACHRAEIIQSDFFDWFTREQWGAWDGTAGNPPFIRFGNWSGPTREVAFDIMRQVGMRPTKLTNAWVPFIVASCLAVRPEGRLALVVPAELLQVTYAAELRAFLIDKFRELTVVTFRRLVFDGILQEVVLLLGTRGEGPAQVRVVELTDMDSLPQPEDLASLPHAPALRHDTEKWTKYFLEPSSIEALRFVRERGGYQRLGEIADVDVGIVTGRNRFFVLRPSTATDCGIERHLSPLVSKSAHLQGVCFEEKDLSNLQASDALCALLALPNSTTPDEPLADYIAAGEEAGVDQGYKCSIRKQWWVVPSVWTPDAFLLRQIYDHPRIIANLTGATSTDTIHRVRMLNGLSPAKLAAASVNSLTFAFSEVMGRSYGGGVLELEPREAEALPFPDAGKLSMRDVRRIDGLLRRGALIEAVNFTDGKLLSELDPDLVLELRRIWERLRDRRLERGRKPAQKKAA